MIPYPFPGRIKHFKSNILLSSYLNFYNCNMCSSTTHGTTTPCTTHHAAAHHSSPTPVMTPAPVRSQSLTTGIKNNNF